MKKLILSVLIVSMLLVSVGMVVAKKDDGCVSIKEGILEYSAGHYFAGTPLVIGYDEFGYNYQAHLFKGSYANVYLGGAGYPPYMGDTDAYLAENPGAASHWAWPYRDVQLSMKWNDAWISNKDCDEDGKLDRHFGFDSYIGSGAWETNHMWGVNEDGRHWNYFTKIVAAPSDAYIDAGMWYTADGVEIGPVLWGEFATIFEVSNDPDYGDHGVLYNGEAPTGFGYYMP
jgi:hypothetical protein